MTKKKSIITKLFVALVALTLISCCFLGSTFARYTSGGNGSATTNIAKWSITATESFGTTPVEFGDLSPAYDVGNRDADVTNPTGKIKVAEIKNEGEVDAKVTFTIDALAAEDFTMLSDAKLGSTDVENWNSTDGWGAAEGSAPSLEAVSSVFSIKLYYGATDGVENATNTISVDGTKTEVSIAANGSVHIYAEVIWTTDYDGGQNADNYDALDTWIGQNIESVTYTISYTAVQASQKPAGN